MNSSLQKQTSLHNGIQMPSIGYSTAGIQDPKKTYQMTLAALQAGFRNLLIEADDNEKDISQAIADSGIDRCQLFLAVQQKLQETDADSVSRAFTRTMRRLQTDYLDLCLISWPKEVIVPDSWKAPEALYKDGSVHALGIQAEKPESIETLLESSEIVPMADLVSVYPGHDGKAVLTSCREHGFVTASLIPDEASAVMQSRELQIFAEKYEKSCLEIAAAYLRQKKCIAYFQGNESGAWKTIMEDFSFQINDTDMKYLDAMRDYGTELPQK